MKKIFFLIICFLAVKISTAQENYQKLIDRASTVDYIFEGVVIETKPYESKNEKTIYTSNLIEITKVFKGDLSCGTVEFITIGGQVREKRMRGAHALQLEKGSKGFFFSRITNKELSIVNFFNATNTEKLDAQFENQSFIKYLEDGSILKAIDMWYNFDSLNQLYDLATLATGFNYVDCNNASTLIAPHPTTGSPIQTPQVFPHYSKQDYQDLINQADNQRANYTRKKGSNRTNYTITYKLANLKITGTSPKYLEFDVTVKDNIGSKYLDQSAVRIKYPTSVFGNNVVANNKILVTRGSINANATCYSNVVPTDRTNNVIFIPALEAVFSQCKSPITSSPLSIMHIKMEIQTCNVANATIAIEDTVTPVFGGTLMSNYSAFAEFPNDTFQTYYDVADANDVKAIPTCNATILDFYPKTVNGGVRDTLTIEGYQFGDTRGSGNVYFIDANNSQASGLTTPLENTDYISWSDTLIKIFVPSIDTGSQDNVVASGKFRVINSNNEKDTSNQNLTVFYSLYNFRDSSTGTKASQFEINKDGSGGQRFYVDTSISHNPQAYGCVKKAIREWVCATGINFVLAGDTFGISNIPQSDGVNLITFGPYAGNGLCFTNFADCGASNAHVLYDYDIIISDNPALTWWYDSSATQNEPQNTTDFYFVILHELGHAVGHNHVNDPNALMYYATPNAYVPGGLSVGQRRVNLKSDASAISGGRKEVYISSLASNVFGCGLQPMIPLPTCAGYSSISDMSNDNAFIKVYPNPFSNSLNLDADSPIQKVVMLSIQGQVIETTNLLSRDKKVEINFDNRNIPQGIYLLEIYTENGKSIKRLIHE